MNGELKENNEFDNKLNVTFSNGQTVTIDVLDIIDSKAYNKSFIIYTVNEDNENVFASILNEETDTYSLDIITNQDEIDFINSEINRVVAELEEE